jgi:hypothetical protein
MSEPKPENAKNPASFAPGDFVHFEDYRNKEDVYGYVTHVQGSDVWVDVDAENKWIVSASSLTFVMPAKTPMTDAAEEYEETILAQDMMEILHG